MIGGLAKLRLGGGRRVVEEWNPAKATGRKTPALP